MRDDKWLWLNFHKYLTILKHMQVCSEDKCNFPQITILSLSILQIIL